MRTCMYDRHPKISTRHDLALTCRCIVIGLIMGGLWYDRSTTLEDARTYFSAIFLVRPLECFSVGSHHCRA